MLRIMQKIPYKKLASILLVCTLLAAVFQILSSAKANGYGDVNNDGIINTTDALLTLRYSVGKINLSAEELLRANVDALGKVNTTDALLILRFAVGKIDIFPAEKNGQDAYYAGLDSYYGVDGHDFTDNTITDLNDVSALIQKLGGDPEKADVENCAITSDGRLAYTPVSNEARQLGTLNKYKDAQTVSGTLRYGDTVLTYTVPKNVTAYDAVPVAYSLVTSASTIQPVHIGVTAFEEASRYENQTSDYFDCNLPGTVDVSMTYDGYVSASTVDGAAPTWSRTYNDTQGNAYPDYSASELTRSGTLAAAEKSWLKFTYRNTGDTILDGEGNGAFNFMPVLLKKNTSGAYEQISITDNYMWRLYDYCYPGEGGDIWLQFADMRGYTPGDYRVVIYGQLRNERENSAWAENYVGGRNICSDSFDFTVTQTGAMTEPAAVQHTHFGAPSRNNWIGKYEEFMSSYSTMSKVSTNSSAPTTGVIYVQPAPWTEALNIKLLHASLPGGATVRIPINVETDSISVTLNPYNNNYYVKSDGTREPLLATQSMVDMRGNTQMGPDAMSTCINDLKNMKEAGINYITTTMAFAYSAKQFDSFKFMMDCLRTMNFANVAAYGSYPSNSESVISNATWIQRSYDKTESAWGIDGLNEANGILAKFTYTRFGDLFWRSNQNILPVAFEDTWGWMTYDHDWRFGMVQTSAINQFRTWLTGAYGTIDKLNAAYGSSYTDFASVDPRKDANYEKGAAAYNFTNTSEGIYQDWSAATMDLDIYRTLARVENYKKILASAGITDAKIAIRSEGSTWLAAGIKSDTTNPHYRQIYFEQRRNAVIPEILAKSGIIYGCSNYDGLPLSASETYEVTKNTSKIGITMLKMPMATHWRDVVPNPYYGITKYATDWNLADDSTCAVNVDTTRALFPYMKAMYEGGGIPGVMWQDYYCDGYLTSTQYKELKFYTSKIQEMLSTEEGHKWATEFDATKTTDDTVRAIWSYPQSYVENAVNNTPRYCQYTDSLTRTK